MKTPKQEKFYIVSDGSAKRTLSEWKRAEVALLLDASKGTDESLQAGAAFEFVMANADQLACILSVLENGRPKGAKDSAPRKKTVKPEAQIAIEL